MADENEQEILLPEPSSSSESEAEESHDFASESIWKIYWKILKFFHMFFN